MEARKEEKSLGELFAELSNDTAVLVRKEVELARSELTTKASRMGRHAAYIAVGGFIAYAGLLALIGALVIILEAMGLTWWASALVVGIVVALAGYLFIQRGISALQRESLAPTETIETLKENAAWAKGQRT
jgi:cation transport ATPase